MTKLAGTIFKVINLFVVIIYLLACLIPFLPAGKFWMVAVLGLAFPVLFVILVVFLIGWLIVKSRWSLLSLITLLLGWQQILAVAGLHSKKDFTIAKTAQTLRILTWNTSSWGETSKNRLNNIEYWPFMIDAVKEQEADVLCFQEFWDSPVEDPHLKIKDLRPPHSNIRSLTNMGYPYHYYVKTAFYKNDRKMGVVILSKFPIVDTATYAYGEQDFAEHLIYADILFHEQKIRVFTTHLQSVRFDNEEYSAISKIKHTDESGLKDSKTIVRKLKTAYQFRGVEADLVKEKIAESPYPVIICGDFNDVPNSYTYFTIKGDLQDAFLKKGTGLGRTFQYLFPTLRIDYILANKNFNVAQYNRVNVPYSDHYPVVADLVPVFDKK